MIKGFEFEAGGRHYCCTIEPRVAGEDWWWFSVSRDPQRYAPFQVGSSDTRASVQARVVAFYDERIFRLSQPRDSRSHWGSRKSASSAPAVTPPAADAT